MINSKGEIEACIKVRTWIGTNWMCMCLVRCYLSDAVHCWTLSFKIYSKRCVNVTWHVDVIWSVVLRLLLCGCEHHRQLMWLYLGKTSPVSESNAKKHGWTKSSSHMRKNVRVSICEMTFLLVKDHCHSSVDVSILGSCSNELYNLSADSI